MKNRIKLFLIIIGLSAGTSKGQYVYNFAGQLNGSGNELVKGMTSDANHNIYIAGYFDGTTLDFDMGPATSTVTTSSSGFDGFLAKYNSNGTLQWGINLSGSGTADAHSSVVDASGNVYLTGSFSGTIDFNPGAGTNNMTSPSGAIGFLVKYDSNGGYIWSEMIGNVQFVNPLSIALSPTNQIYMTGFFSSSNCDFDPGAGSTILSATLASYDIFFASYNSSDGSIVGAFSLGGSSFDQGISITTDGSGNAIIGGIFNGTVDFDPGIGVSNLTSTSTESGFIMKISPAGVVSAVTLLPDVFYVAADASDNIYVLGKNFIGKYNSTGTQLWRNDIGTSSTTFSSGNIVVESNGDVTMCTAGGGFLAGGTTMRTQMSGGGCFAKYDANGVLKTYKDIGTTCKGVAYDASGNIIVVGYFTTAIDFDTRSTNSVILTPNSYDVFFAKYDKCSGYATTSTLNLCPGQSVTYNNHKYTAVGTQVYYAVNNVTLFAIDVPLDFKEILTAANGCDSVVTATITTEVFNTNLTSNAQGLTSLTIGATYQWLDCFNSYATIPSANAITFAPSVNGQYAVEMSKNGCKDTSVCITKAAVTSTLEAIEQNELNIYPNPVKDDVLIFNISSSEKMIITIYNAIGEVQFKSELSSGNNAADISKLSKGLYIVVAERGTTKMIKRFERE